MPLTTLLIGFVIMAWAWPIRENTTYVVTNRAFYQHRGAIAREVKRVA